MKRTYVKSNHKYWNMKKINKHSMRLWKAIVVFMALFVIWALINRWANRNPLVSPIVISPVQQVQASESISCESPKGYLECKAYRGEITWEQHDRIYKVIECESKWNPDAIHVNKNGSVDRGLVQSNSVHIKTLSNADAFNFKKSIDWMISKMHRDGNLNAWVCNRLIK